MDRKIEIYIGINGSGKTWKIDKKIDEILESKENVVFDLRVNLLDFPEESTSEPTPPKIEKAFWGRFANKLEEITSLNISLSREDILKYTNESINKDFADNIKLFKDEIKIDLFNDGVNSFMKKDNVNGEIVFEKQNIIDQNYEISLKYFNFKERLLGFLSKNSTPIEKNKGGTGNYKYLAIKFIFELVEEGLPFNKNLFIIIDEPENFLHYSLQRKVSFMLKKISEKASIIISTHSPVIVAPLLSTDSSLKLYKLKDRDVKEVNLTTWAKNGSLTLKENLLKNLFADKIFVVEGQNDLEYLEFIINYVREKSENIINENYNIFIVDGKSKIKTSIQTLVENYDIDKSSLFVVFDEDKNSPRYSQKCELTEQDGCLCSVKSRFTHKNLNKEIIDYCSSDIKMISFENNIENEFDLDKPKWNELSAKGKLIDELINKNKSKVESDSEIIKNFLKID